MKVKKIYPAVASDYTKSMGLCHCGDCCVNVFADGSIQYIGKEDWQRSERFMPTFPQNPRDYHSELGVKHYVKLWERAIRHAHASLEALKEALEEEEHRKAHPMCDGSYKEVEVEI